ncbi:hypothetical protein [Streptomyces scopuliridis]|uniref:hypothetical protein n=1 Tax=Streptomyces scopuliridis TaxID=452529 RepID=UPI0036CA759A
MSARDTLMALVFRAATRGTYEGLADETRTALDAHAHELAEQIRTEVQTLKVDGVLEPDKDWAAGDAANLIDPGVTA